MRNKIIKLPLLLLLIFTCVLGVLCSSCKNCKNDAPPKPGPGPDPKPNPEPEVTVSIQGKSEVRSGNEARYTAYIDGEISSDVTWEIRDGADYASISKDGVFTAKDVKGDKIIELVARSTKNKKCEASKAILIVSKPNLTQAMLDALKVDKIGFEGYLSIDVSCVYGGSAIGTQISELRRGREIVVATPGRFIEILCLSNGKITNLRRVRVFILILFFHIGYLRCSRRGR